MNFKEKLDEMRCELGVFHQENCSEKDNRIYMDYLREGRPLLGVSLCSSHIFCFELSCFSAQIVSRVLHNVRSDPSLVLHCPIWLQSI